MCSILSIRNADVIQTSANPETLQKTGHHDEGLKQGGSKTENLNATCLSYVRDENNADSKRPPCLLLLSAPHSYTSLFLTPPPPLILFLPSSLFLSSLHLPHLSLGALYRLQLQPGPFPLPPHSLSPLCWVCD